MSRMRITFIIYFDLRHVSIFVTFINLCISLLSLSGLNARYMMKTMYTRKDNVTWVHIQIENDFDECYMGHHAKRIQLHVIWSVIFVMILFYFYLCWHSYFVFNFCIFHRFVWLFLQRRSHTHTTPTHINRQTDTECAWGRPRLLNTVLNCYFLDLSWHVTKGLLRDYFT